MERNILAADIGIHLNWLIHREGIDWSKKLEVRTAKRVLARLWEQLSKLDDLLRRDSGFYTFTNDKVGLTPGLVSDTIYVKDWKEWSELDPHEYKYNLSSSETTWNSYCYVMERVMVLENYFIELPPKQEVSSSLEYKCYLVRELETRVTSPNYLLDSVDKKEVINYLNSMYNVLRPELYKKLLFN